MPTPPFATLQVSVNGGPPQTGAVTVSTGQTIQLSGLNTSAWQSQTWEIYDYPPGFNPGGTWVLAADGLTWQNSKITPDSFSTGATWGKWMLRLRVNGNPLTKNADGSPTDSFSQKLTDESTVLRWLSPHGLEDTGFLELNQTSQKGYVGGIQKNWRIIDPLLGGGGGGVTVTGVDVVGADNAHAYVVSVSGPGGGGGTIPLNVAGLQFDTAQTSPTFSQAAAATTGTAPVSMFWAPQAPHAGATGTTFGTPGSATVSLALPGSGGNNARLAVTENSATLFQVGNNDAIFGAGSYLYLGANAATPGAPALTWFPGGSSTAGASVMSLYTGVLDLTGDTQSAVGVLSDGRIWLTGGSKSSNPSDVQVFLHKPNGSVYGGLVVEEFSTGAHDYVPFFRLDNGTGGSGFGGTVTGMWMGPAAASPTDQNWILGVDTSGNTYLDSAVLNGGSIVCNANGIVHVYAPAFALELEATGGGGLNAAVELACDYNASTYAIQVSAGTLGGAANRHYTSLNWLSNLEPTATNIPNGDGLTFVGNRRARPTTSPTGGAELFAEAGQLWVMPGDGSNTAFQISASGGGGGGGTVTGVDVVGADNAHVYVVKISGSGGAGGPVTLLSSAYLAVSANCIIAKQASTPVIAIVGGVLTLSGSSAGVVLEDSGFPVAQFQAAPSDFAAFGTTPGTIGFIRATTNATIVGANGSSVLSTDASVNVIVGDNTTHGVQLWAGGADLCSLTGSGSADYIYFGLPGVAATSGNVRAVNAQLIVGARAFGGGSDINVLSTDTSNNVIVGGVSGGGGACHGVLAYAQGNQVLQLESASGDFITVGSSGVTINPLNVTWNETATNPQITQTTRSTDATTYNLSITAQSAWTSAATNVNGGSVIISGGRAKSDASTGLRGGVSLQLTVFPMVSVAEVVVGQKIVALCATTTVNSTNMPASSGDGVIFVANAISPPAANASGGGILYAQAGAIKWRGSSGTITTMGPADPHCPVCQSDFMTEHENAVYGYLSVCLKCLADELGGRPWIVRKKAA